LDLFNTQLKAGWTRLLFDQLDFNSYLPTGRNLRIRSILVIREISFIQTNR